MWIFLSKSCVLKHPRQTTKISMAPMLLPTASTSIEYCSPIVSLKTRSRPTVRKDAPICDLVSLDSCSGLHRCGLFLSFVLGTQVRRSDYPSGTHLPA